MIHALFESIIQNLGLTKNLEKKHPQIPLFWKPPFPNDFKWHFRESPVGQTKNAPVNRSGSSGFSVQSHSLLDVVVISRGKTSSFMV